MESAEYDLIEIAKLTIGKKIIYVLILLIGFVISFSISAILVYILKESANRQPLNIILVTFTMFLVLYPFGRFYYDRTVRLNKTGKFVITKNGVEIHCINTKKYNFSDLKRIYYKYDKAEFDFMNKYPKALTYRLTIIDNEDNKTIVRIMRKHNKNTLLPKAKNDLETVFEELRKSNHKIYQIIRSAD